MNRDARLAQLVDFVTDRGTVRVEDVVTHLEVSAATVRRDLDALADQQLITRTRGGARSNATSGDVPMRYRSARNAKEKSRIAAEAASLVRPGEVIAFNGGTTTTAAAYEVGVRTSSNPAFADSLLTVVTNAVNIASDLVIRPEIRVVVTGGVARTRSYELIGPLSECALPMISIDTLFLGVNAIDESGTLFTHHEGEAAINGALVRIARRVVVLVDSSKLNKSAFARICDRHQYEAIITDADTHSPALRHLRSLGVKTISV